MGMCWPPLLLGTDWLFILGSCTVSVLQGLYSFPCLYFSFLRHFVVLLSTIFTSVTLQRFYLEFFLQNPTTTFAMQPSQALLVLRFTGKLQFTEHEPGFAVFRLLTAHNFSKLVCYSTHLLKASLKLQSITIFASVTSHSQEFNYYKEFYVSVFTCIAISFPSSVFQGG